MKRNAREVNWWLAWRRQIPQARSRSDLARALREYDKEGIATEMVTGFVSQDVISRAVDLDIADPEVMTSGRYRGATEGRLGLARDIVGRRGNPASRGKSSKKKTPCNSRHLEMPDPGPCAHIGSILEWCWVSKGRDITWKPKAKDNWMFMWSPKLKAIVSIKNGPRTIRNSGAVRRSGGAAKKYEIFMDRSPGKTSEISVPIRMIHRMGDKAKHVVYRSDKWDGENSDYIHKLGLKGSDVYLLCGPSIDNPEVFLCMCGKLTLTKRGLVW